MEKISGRNYVYVAIHSHVKEYDTKKEDEEELSLKEELRNAEYCLIKQAQLSLDIRQKNLQKLTPY